MIDEKTASAFRLYAERWDTLQQERYRTRASRFRAIAAEAHADWRLGCIPPRWGDSTVFIFREGIYDLVRMHLTIAYMPLFQSLKRIELRYKVLVDLRKEPWASPKHRVNAP